MNSHTEDLCNLMEECKNYKDVYREKFGIEYDKFKGADEDYRLSIEEEKHEHMNTILAR